MADAPLKINVTHPQYGAQAIDPSELQKYQEMGFRAETREEEAARAREQEFDNPLAAGVVAFGRGVSLGGTSLVNRALGNADIERGLQEANPTADIVGEVASAFVPTGGAGLAAKAGRAAEGLVARKVGAGITDRVVDRALSKAVGGFAEGAVFGAGQGVSDVALSKDPRSAEDILLGIGSSALFGGGVGGAVGGGAALLGRGLEVGAERLRAFGGRAEAAEAAKVAAKAGGAAPVVDDALAEVTKKRGLTAEARAAGRTELDRLKGAIDEERAFKDQGFTDAYSDAKAAGRETSDALKSLRDELREVDSVGRQARARVRAQLDEAKGLVAEGETEIGVALKRYEETAGAFRQHFPGELVEGASAKGRGKGFVTSLDDDALRAAAGDPAARAAYQAHRDATLDVLRSLNPGKQYDDLFGKAASTTADAAEKLGEVEKRLAGLADDVGPDRLVLLEREMDDLERAMKEGRDGLRAAQETIDAGKAAGIRTPTAEDVIAYAKKSGLDVVPQPGTEMDLKFRAGIYRDAAKAKIAAGKLEAQAAAKAQKAALGAAEKSDEALKGVAEGVGQAAGTAVGGALGGWAGAWVGNQAGSLLGKAGARYVGRLWAHRGKVAKTIADGIDGFLGAAPRARTPAIGAGTSILQRVAYGADAAAKTGSRKEAAKARIGELRKAMTDPLALRRQIHERLGQLWATDPKLADQVEALAMKRIEFLASKSPLPPPRPMGRAEGANWHLGDLEVDRLERYVRAAEEGPARLLEEAAAGRLTRETVETVKALYPEAYEQIRAEVVRRIPEMREDMPHAKRLALGALLDAPVDPTQEPLRIKAWQARYAAAKEAKAAQGVGKNDIGSVKLASRTQATVSERLSGGGPA